uniref:ATP-dependent RNA helicase n=1 Tax=Macrostomum lignano TaxID=282301 RepID=A0A1I8IQM3_9PLAT
LMPVHSQVSLLTEKLGLEYFTKVQAETLPLVLAGKDVLIKTQTGSGKSLALLLPLVQQLQAVQPPLSRSSGTQALVLCPTHTSWQSRATACCSSCSAPSSVSSAASWSAGVKRKSQKASLRRGLNILVATPRRLLDHLERSSRLHLGSGIRMLIIDEADRLAELGFERDVRRIVEAVCACGRRPQTLLCSATLTDGTERLAGLALSQPSCVSEEAALPASVQHFVLAAPTRMRLRALLSALRPALAAGHKAALFLPTQASVDFHHGLLSALLSDSVPLCRLHGNLAHADRIRAFREFASRGGSGLLVTTDVSARGLDLSRLSWVIQGPGEPQLYCHRAGRTARLGRPGRCLLLLDSAEVAPYLRLLTAPDSPGRSLRFAPVPAGRLMARCCPENFGQLTQLVADTEQLRALAEDAFVSTVRARATFAGDLRAALPMPHLGHLASSFCLADPPGVIAANARRRRHPEAVEAAEAAAASAKTERRTSKVSAGRRVRTGGAAVDRLSEFASGI